ncbi:MAG TPA: hypothetical protein VMM93_07645 [Vicinamibacterales bacterium]|nr:hypothetical protein [Vicinamibacterales bacterium]
MSALRRRAAGVLLVVDGAGAAMTLAMLLSVIATHQPTAIVMVIVRAVAGAIELVGGMLLLQAREPGVTVARTGAVAAAVAGTLGIGLRLAPSSLDPSMRMPVVVGYWLFAVVVVGLTRQGPRDPQ